MVLEKFDHIYQRAAERKGGVAHLEALLGQPLSAAELATLGDDRVLAQLTKKVFKSGFVWRVVEQKWPAFETLFFNFEIEKILMMPPDMLERKASDPAIIRNARKVKTIYDNALMIKDVQTQTGHSFAKFIAQWPSNDIVSLWRYLKQHGQRLGGNTGPYALRSLGKDTFLLTQDVEVYLRANQLIDGGLMSLRSLSQSQDYFNQWQAESGRSLQAISQIISFSVGDNRVGLS
ncbi:DNA-3-methyladenine glycosylase I [Gayadomonas joobiniege]|uniref:DNA-3-methyladenine glycosylase I n=1 Tax=Gayadomonas joobiniege TaxID=1234606 RepID=UPI00036ED3B8|nr:DNA-3-methyladenine glycosylase I [Gayadomonas joobiniege]